MTHDPSPILSLIVAVARNGVIGRDNKLPWHLPADLKHFKSVTMGKPVVMGRKTWESIGRPLPGRKNIVISRNPDFRAEGCEVVSSLDAALRVCAGAEEIFVIGGSQLYAEALNRASRLYVTRIEDDVAGDTFFPAIDPAAWQIVSSEIHAPDERNRLPFRFEMLERV
jgi:dihydrofolate reductase